MKVRLDNTFKNQNGEAQFNMRIRCENLYYKGRNLNNWINVKYSFELVSDNNRLYHFQVINFIYFSIRLIWVLIKVNWQLILWTGFNGRSDTLGF